MGCVVSTIIGALWCRKGCNASELAGEFAYFPPSPSSYAVERRADGTLALSLNPFYFQVYTALGPGRSPAEVVELRSHGNVAIPAFFFREPGARVTFLFSHSNAVDLGFLYRHLDEMARRLKANVLAYEFSGYGPTQQVATPRNYTQRADVLAACEYLRARGFDPARQVIAYGQSIGSYPTLHLAARQRLLGVVLHSPLASGLQVITRVEGCCAPHRVYACIEPYPNASLIRRVRDPVLVIHGTADETVECRHGQGLHARCPTPARYEPYWVPGATHEDVIDTDPQEYFNRLEAFVAHCEARRAAEDGAGGLEAAKEDGERDAGRKAWRLRGAKEGVANVTARPPASAGAALLRARGFDAAPAPLAGVPDLGPGPSAGGIPDPGGDADGPELEAASLGTDPEPGSDDGLLRSATEAEAQAVAAAATVGRGPGAGAPGNDIRIHC